MDMPYGVSSRASLARAIERLGATGRQNLFYAAFELRCGIEARMQEYLNAWEHISVSKKKGWQIKALATNIEQAFKTGNNVIRWSVADKETGESLLVLYHTPVSPRLHDLGGKLGDYLHSLKTFRPEADPWWDDFRQLLHEAVELLRQANIGTLLGPPLEKRGSGEVRMQIELPDEEAGKKLVELMGGGLHTVVKVEYLDRCPDELESTAHQWPASWPAWQR